MRVRIALALGRRGGHDCQLGDAATLEVRCAEVSPRLGVGEAADFTFTPTEPGTYELVIGYAPVLSWRQRWEVLAGN